MQAGAVDGAIGTPIRDAIEEKLSRELEPTRSGYVELSCEINRSFQDLQLTSIHAFLQP